MAQAVASFGRVRAKAYLPDTDATSSTAGALLLVRRRSVLRLFVFSTNRRQTVPLVALDVMSIETRSTPRAPTVKSALRRAPQTSTPPAPTTTLSAASALVGAASLWQVRDGQKNCFGGDDVSLRPQRSLDRLAERAATLVTPPLLCRRRLSQQTLCSSQSEINRLRLATVVRVFARHLPRHHFDAVDFRKVEAVILGRVAAYKRQVSARRRLFDWF